MKDELAALLYLVFDEDRKQQIMPPQRAQQMLENLRNMLYNDVSYDKKAEMNKYG